MKLSCPAKSGALINMRITNHQFPITKQYPNTNNQIPNKLFRLLIIGY